MIPVPKAVVFFDLDGTLLRDDKSLAPSTIDAVKQLRKNDVIPIVATGRNIFEIQYVLDETGMDSIVSANGSYIEFQGKKLSAATIPLPLIEEFNQFAYAHDAPVAWYNNKTFAQSESTPITRANYKLLSLDETVDPTWYQHNEVNFMFIYTEARDEMFQEEFAGKLSLVRNNPHGLDTMLTGVSKRTGILTLLDHAGLKGVPTYGFGNEENDRQMLELVDHPVVVANGTPSIKAIAEYVTTSNMTDGITKGLAHFGLI